MSPRDELHDERADGCKRPGQGLKQSKGRLPISEPIPFFVAVAVGVKTMLEEWRRKKGAEGKGTLARRRGGGGGGGGGAYITGLLPLVIAKGLTVRCLVLSGCQPRVHAAA